MSEILALRLDIEGLIDRVVRSVSQVMQADRASLFLVDPLSGDLWSKVAQGEESREIRIPAGSGVAGWVAQHDQWVNILDAHADPRFNPEVDQRTGYRTRSVLCAPVKNLHGEIIGVMQILNKQGGDFDENDLAVLEIVACVAAASIETAQLARAAQTAAIANAVGDLSHDIKNKVAPIVMATYTLRPDMDAMFDALDAVASSVPADVAARLRDASEPVRQAYGDAFDVIVGQVDAVQEYTRLIADALKGTVTEPQLERNDLALVVEAQLSELDGVARSRGLTCIRRFAAVPVCRFDRFQIEILRERIHQFLVRHAGGDDRVGSGSRRLVRRGWQMTEVAIDHPVRHGGRRTGECARAISRPGTDRKAGAARAPVFALACGIAGRAARDEDHDGADTWRVARRPLSRRLRITIRRAARSPR
jgi:putative methionine-R-sulfoxide reductase with GAF domain